jgi:hypothetical protein
MEMATPGVWEGILNIIISFVALFTPPPAPLARFADFTERHIGENIGFVVCEVELMAPRMMARIEGGEFLISSPENNEAMLGFLSKGCP